MDLFESAIRLVDIAPFEATGFGDAVMKIRIFGAHRLMDFCEQRSIDVEPLSEQLMSRFRIACKRLIRTNGEVSSIPFAFWRVLNHLTLSLQGSQGRHEVASCKPRGVYEKRPDREPFGNEKQQAHRERAKERGWPRMGWRTRHGMGVWCGVRREGVSCGLVSFQLSCVAWRGNVVQRCGVAGFCERPLEKTPKPIWMDALEFVWCFVEPKKTFSQRTCFCPMGRVVLYRGDPNERFPTVGR